MRANLDRWLDEWLPVTLPSPQWHSLGADGNPQRLLAPFAAQPGAVWLDSAMCGYDTGRWSFLARDPVMRLEATGRLITIHAPHGRLEFDGNPFLALEVLLNRFSIPVPADAPLPSLAAGFLGYDLLHHVERAPRTTTDPTCFPELAVYFYDTVVSHDHMDGDTRLGQIALPGRASLTDVVDAWSACTAPPAADFVAGAAVSGTDRNDYLAAVARVREYIAAGDVFQVNLSQQFHAPFRGSPWRLYQRLREINPAPFAAYFNTDHGTIVSASPEEFLHFDPRTRRMRTRPIKGTRPRGRTAEKDNTFRQELLASEKDHAEHLMIVDLERNDLGRVAAAGTVRVDALAALETFPTVHHLTSTVSAVARPEVTRTEILGATFPGGSITGAPKIRAMEIIDELEPVSRNVYTGAIGYFGCDGGMHLNIAIRTVVVAQGRAWMHVGGGIVIDSDPAAEYDETLDKGLALFAALQGGDDAD